MLTKSIEDACQDMATNDIHAPQITADYHPNPLIQENKKIKSKVLNPHLHAMSKERKPITNKYCVDICDAYVNVDKTFENMMKSCFI